MIQPIFKIYKTHWTFPGFDVYCSYTMNCFVVKFGSGMLFNQSFIYS